MKTSAFRAYLIPAIAILALACGANGAPENSRKPVPRQHPYLLGTRDELRSLARERATEYQRMVRVAHDTKADSYSRIMSGALVSAIEGDGALASEVQKLTMEYVNGPIRVGHVTFAYDLALCGFAFDLCHDAWPEADRLKFYEYVNKTVDANVNSERSVFHNAWYGYKNWGIGVASYSSYYENPRAQEHLRVLEEDYRTRAVPALKHAGDGGSWAEGYYIHYWIYEWLVFCEVALHCDGTDYYAPAEKFYRNRALAAMFETYPGLSEYNTRRSVPMGDSGGRLYGGDRDKDLAARRILVSHYRNDEVSRVVHTFNETTPRVGGGNNAYKDFLWHDTSVQKGDLKNFKLSHYSPGPGFVFARSSWNEDATYLFFKCGDRFTAHQHLDVGHFDIYKNAELAGDGGHYSDFGGVHDVNYHLRTIAHSTMLVMDPKEKWPPNIRAGKSVVNDGGQTHSWPHHNGAVSDPAEWEKQKSICDIADMLAYEEHGDYVYMAGDATRSYSSNKLELFTRQIVFLRPNSFVIFDRVTARQPEFRKTWLLQAMKAPEKRDGQLVVSNGKGRLFVQTVLPVTTDVRCVTGEELYLVNGKNYPPPRNTGPAPECRVEISPTQPRRKDYFLHVLTTADTATTSAPKATATQTDGKVKVNSGNWQITFGLDQVSADISIPAESGK